MQQRRAEKMTNFERIEHRATAILTEAKAKIGILASPPIPVDRIAADFFGFKIKANLRETGITGRLVVTGNQIRVRPRKDITNDPSAEVPFSARQRFTIAHELGHLVLHVQSSGNQFHICSKKGTPVMEREANVFSAALLMPWRLLYRTLVSTISDLYPHVDFYWLQVYLSDLKENEQQTLNTNIFRLALENSLEVHDRAVLIAKIVPEMARLFGVSKESMTWRLKTVGLLEGILT